MNLFRKAKRQVCLVGHCPSFAQQTAKRCPNAAGVLLFNFFFTTPKFSLMAYDKGYPVAFIVMLIASLVTGSIAARMKSHAKQSAQAAYRTKILLDTNQMLAKAKSADEIFEIAVEQTKKLLSVDAFAVCGEELDKLVISGTNLYKIGDCTYYPIHASNLNYACINFSRSFV